MGHDLCKHIIYDSKNDFFIQKLYLQSFVGINEFDIQSTNLMTTYSLHIFFPQLFTP